MKLILTFLSIVYGSICFSFVEPDTLVCTTKRHLVISGMGKRNALDAGTHRIPLKSAAIVSILDGSKIVAKLYPQNGINSILLKKSLSYKTDQRTYWNLFRRLW